MACKEPELKNLSYAGDAAKSELGRYCHKDATLSQMKCTFYVPVISILGFFVFFLFF